MGSIFRPGLFYFCVSFFFFSFSFFPSFFPARQMKRKCVKKHEPFENFTDDYNITASSSIYKEGELQTKN